MRENFTLKGNWFLPDRSEIMVVGALTFEFDKGTKLELLGSLSDTSSKTIETDIILGLTTDGKQITLYKCYESSRTISLPGQLTSIWTIIFTIEGGHFATKEDLTFHSIATSFHNLNEWLAISGFKTSPPDYVKHKSKISYTLPKPINFDINNDVSGQFNFEFKPPSIGFNYEISLKQRARYIVITKEKELGIEQLLDYMSNFQNFLTLGTYEASFPLEIKLKSKVVTEEINGKNYPINYNLFYNVSLSPYSNRPKILWEFMFNYRDIKRNYKKIIKKWYHNYNEIEPVLNLLMETFYQRGNFNANKFLNMAQALETFHRRRRKNNVLTEKQHKKRITEINKSIPKRYRDFINEKLLHSNEPSLHMRLDMLFQEFNTKTFSKIVSDKDKFIKQTKDSRNYYTHYDVKMEKKALKRADLFYLTERLKVILVSAVLRETGFSYDLIENLLERNEYKYFNHIFEP
jgi:hypothetical protein